jgi:hypothetical protein
MSQAAAQKPEDLRLIKERLEKKFSGPFQLLSRQDVSDYFYVLQAERESKAY